MKNFLQKSLNIALYKNKPTSLIHFITNRCNARCPHCFIDFDDDKSQNDSISLENLTKLAKSAGPQLMNVNITGGEPFLDNNIEQVCRIYLDNTSIDSMFFSTNGALTNKVLKIATALAKDFPSTIFTYSISIDHIKERHDNYRKVKDLYNKAIKTYHSLNNLAENIQANVTITVCDENLSDIEEIFNHLFYTENIKSITANIVRNEGVFQIDKTKYQNIFQAYSKLIKLITHNNVQYNSQNFLGKMMNEKESILYQYIEKVFLNPQYQLPCNAGAGLLGVIYPNGDVYPCEILSKKMGNLYDYNMDIQKLWKSNVELRKWIKKTKCHCTYECAWSYNILSSPKHMAKLALAPLKK